MSVRYQRRGHAAWAVMDRPAELNAIDEPMLAGLVDAMDRADSDDDVRVLVVTGAGRAFCAGGDLKTLLQKAERDPRGFRGFSEDFGAVLARLEAFPKPVVGAVNGAAMAGGLELLLCCDILIAAETARIGDGHVRYGLIPGAGASARLPRMLGQPLATFLMLSGEALPAADFLTSGFLSQVVPPENLEAAVDGLVDMLARKSPLALRRIKKLLHEGRDLPLASALEAELSECAEHLASRDAAEGLDAFVQKRTPNFFGR
jgi:enoyl-CoA hydratase